MNTNEFILKIRELEDKYGKFHAVYLCCEKEYKLDYKLHPMFSKNFKSATEFISDSIVTIMVSKYIDTDQQLKIVTVNNEIYKFSI